MQRARRECGTWRGEGVGQTFPLDLVGPANNVFILRAVETVDGHWAVVRGTWTNQVWKDAPPFFPLNGEASALSDGSCSFSHTQDWASVIRVVIVLLHGATSVHFSSTSLIGTPSSKLHTTCHLLLALDCAPDFPGPLDLALSPSQLLQPVWVTLSSVVRPQLIPQPQSLVLQRLS